MNINQALGIIRPDEPSQESLKKAYRKACFSYHPDAGGSVEMMQLVNLAMELLTNCKLWWTPYQAKKAQKETPLTETIQDIIDKVGHLPGLTFEMVGDWLWITGNTRTYKGLLKQAGLKFSSNKIAWYWHPPGYRKHTKKQFDMNEIKTRYGCWDINIDKNKTLVA